MSDSCVAGAWDVTIKTPIGSLSVRYEFAESSGGLTGFATSKDETVVLHDLAIEGQRLTWRQSVTKPIRLNLDFDVSVEGDQLSGHSRAGRLPRSTVTGARRS